MAREWEEFDYTPKVVLSDIHVSIGPRGRMLIGKRAMELLGQPATVMMLFCRAEKIIAIKPVHPRHPKAITLRSNGRDHYRLLPVMVFCKKYGIELGRTFVFNEPEIENRTLLLDTNAVTFIGKPRREAK